MDDKIEGKQVLVTGSTDGIGKETARMLAQEGARVILHGRSLSKAKAACSEIRQLTGNRELNFIIADFASLQQVRKLANEVRRTYPAVQILINNAGIYAKNQSFTEDGFERTFQVNYLAPFLLTNELLGVLGGNRPSRIVNVTSMLHQGASLDFEALLDPLTYEGHRAYATSKLALTLFTFELAKRLGETGLTANCVHPGGVNTKLLRAGYGAYGLTPEEGAEPVFQLAASAGLSRTTGKYFARSQPSEPDPRCYDDTLRRRVWNYTNQVLHPPRDFKRAA